MNVVGFFFATTLIPAGLNSNIVTLVPKFIGASKIEDFRPIVLGNFLFKIFTKIISTRLGPLLKRVLSTAQYGFIPEKSIQHCIATCSECFQCINKGSENMALKIDIQKAFDTMHWDFLLKVLECMGLPFQKVDNFDSSLGSVVYIH